LVNVGVRPWLTLVAQCQLLGEIVGVRPQKVMATDLIFVVSR
jgi:hypothetical protein